MGGTGVSLAAAAGEDISSHYSFKADIWSFGMIFYELLTLQLPYSDLPPHEAMAERERGHPPPMPPRSGPPLPFKVDSPSPGGEEKRYHLLLSIYRQLSVSNPSQRPDASRTRLLIDEGIEQLY
jgi:serine/threonine protein kinase